MKVSGFTFVRNAIKYDYPVVESITSILPIVDEMIVSVGDSSDDTLALIQSIDSPKIKIVHSVWDDSLREGGKVLAVETDKAFDAVAADSDWAFYIQADEVVHEQYHDAIVAAMKKYKDDKSVEGLLFKYLHFYGSYRYVGDSRTYYKNEIRIVRNNKEIRSYRDAQGFRKHDEKLWVKPIDAYMYHYGWVKDVNTQKEKIKNNIQMYVGNESAELNRQTQQADALDYAQIDSLTLFKGTHPRTMAERMKRFSWEFEFDIKKKHFSFKDRILYWIEKYTGRRLFDYKNYRIR